MPWITRLLGSAIAALAIAAVILLIGVPRVNSRQVGGTSEPSWPPEPFTVAVVWPADEADFARGVTFAFDEVNAAGTPLSGKMGLAVVDEGRDEDAMKVARRVAARGDVVAVLGHESSASAISASLVYDRHGLLFLAPTATSPQLTHHAFRLVFRLTPGDRGIAAAHAAFAKSRGWSTVAVFHARTAGGEAAGAQFISHMREAGIHVPFIRSYQRHQANDYLDFRPLIASMSQHTFDAVMIADQLPGAADLVADLRKMGYAGPILGSDKLDANNVWAITGGAAQDLYVSSAVDPSAHTPAYLAFHNRYMRRWNEAPTYAATQGYDALRLLADAMMISQAVDPLTVSTTLRTRRWAGLFGNYSFTWSGDIEGRRIFIKRMDAGRFVTIDDGKEVDQ